MTSWHLLWTDTARRHAIEIQSQWIDARAEAPTLFLDELHEATSLLRAQPTLGMPYLHPREEGLRRVLLARSGHHVYYRVDEARREIAIVAIWHGARRGPPVLGR